MYTENSFHFRLVGHEEEATAEEERHLDLFHIPLKVPISHITYHISHSNLNGEVDFNINEVDLNDDDIIDEQGAGSRTFQLGEVQEH